MMIFQKRFRKLKYFCVLGKYTASFLSQKQSSEKKASSAANTNKTQAVQRVLSGKH
jgi:hypothetical protein